MKVLLYGTGHCHLCELAKALLQASGASVEYIDIAQDAAMLEKYGTRIPVVRRIDNGVELDWPFDEAMLNELAGARARVTGEDSRSL